MFTLVITIASVLQKFCVGPVCYSLKSEFLTVKNKFPVLELSVQIT